MANANPSRTPASVSTASANISDHRCLVSTQRWHDWKRQAVRHRVLIADDDPRMLQYLREVLAQAGYQLVATAGRRRSSP